MLVVFHLVWGLRGLALTHSDDRVAFSYPVLPFRIPTVLWRFRLMWYGLTHFDDGWRSFHSCCHSECGVARTEGGDPFHWNPCVVNPFIGILGWRSWGGDPFIPDSHSGDPFIWSVAIILTVVCRFRVMWGGVALH